MYYYDIGNTITGEIIYCYHKRADLWGEYEGKVLHVIHEGPQEGHNAHIEDIIVALMNIKGHICLCTLDEPTGYIGSIGVKASIKRFPEHEEVFKGIFNTLKACGQEVL